ncbi:YCF48-related protein [Roseofilum sp. BLCC_M91]|uniref:YCF48-related protein n=1 Tax=Roseofilum halophilum BLCC-M91 TaxID=3022259 RepID=A0ABT7BQ03_9CYAN|nr:YCF48-related protein [Roseofilum halophilum]MDJ1180368.1 YCF48-related protein [Roseofilum halophilum BLCC-M91]
MGILCFLSLLIYHHHDRALAHRPHDVVSQVRISPTYDRDQTLFILVRDNLFKSTDGGFYWQRLSNNIDNKADFSSLDISHQNPKTLLLSSPQDGIYKSVDSGQSWSAINQGINPLKISLVAISPYSDQIFLAAGAENGLYQTENSGKNWSQTLKNSSHITAIEFVDANQIMIGDSQGNIYRSLDRGKTWNLAFTVQNSGAITAFEFPPNFSTNPTFWIGTQKGGIVKTENNGLSFTTANDGLSDFNIRDILLIPSQNNPSTLLVSTWTDGLFKSTDGGQTWNHDNQGITQDYQADTLEQPHFSNIQISNRFDQDQTVFLGGFNGLFKSTDGGNVWEELETLSPGTIVAMAVSPDYDNDSTIAAVSYVGETYISKDQGNTWSPMNKGLEIPRFTRKFEEISINQDPRRFFDIAFSPNYDRDNTLFTSVLWSKFLVSNNRGESWKIVPLSKEVRGITITPSPDFANDRTVYLASQEGIIFRSTDGGFNFSIIGKIKRVSGNDPPSVVISPNFSSDQTLYASTSEGIYKTTDGGQNWQPTNNINEILARNNYQLVISPNYANDNTLFLGTNQGLFKTQDAGKIWEQVTSSLDIQNGYIGGMNISPNYSQDQTLILSVKGQGLLKTVDGGQTFTPIGNPSLSLSRMHNVPSAYRSIQFSPSYAIDQTIYGFGSAETEIFKSTDGGNSWQTLSIPRTIPTYEYNYNFLTTIDLMLYVYSSQIKKIIVSLAAALVSYFILGFLKLEQRLKLPIGKHALQIAGSSLIFVLALIIFFT